MTAALLDVNMLIALAWRSHVHHRQAHAWFAANQHKGWATCPFTQCAFVRLSSNPKIIPEAVTPAEALELMRKIVALRHHVFWPDDIPILANDVPSTLIVTHRQVTDAYLLGLTIRNNGRLVTLDAGIAELLPPDSPHRAALVVVSAAE